MLIAEKSQSTRNECVQVIVRCRPMSNKEKASNFQHVVDVYPNRGVIEIVNASEPSKENKKMFTYDAVYNEKGSQQMIYDEVVRPLVSSVLEGFNGCVFGEFARDRDIERVSTLAKKIILTRLNHSTARPTILTLKKT